MNLRGKSIEKICSVLVIILMLIGISFQIICAAMNSPLISKVFVKYENGMLKCNILASKAVKYKVTNMSDPRQSIIFDIYPAQLDLSAKKEYIFKDGDIEGVRVKQFSDNPDIVRMVVDVKKPIRYNVVMHEESKGLFLSIGDQKIAVAEDTKAVVESLDIQKEKNIKPQNKIENKTTNIVAQITPKDNDEQAPEKPIIKVAPPVKEDNIVKGKTAKKSKNIKPQPKYALEYDRVDLLFILSELAKKSGANIIVSQSVKGNITIKFKAITLENALQYILSTTGFSFKKISNIYIVGSEQELNLITPNNLISGSSEKIEVINLKYAKADQISTTLTENVPNLTPMVDPRLNAIVVRGSDIALKEARELVKQLDIPPQAIEPGNITKVVRLNYTDLATADKLIKKWYPSVEIIQDARINALIMTSDEETFSEVDGFLAKLDVPQKQVILDVKIISLAETARKQLGTQWAQGSGMLFTVNLFEAANPATQAAPPTAIGLPIRDFARSPLSISMAMSYLINEGKAKIVASPKIATYDGKEANINVGQRYPITYPDPRAGGLQCIYIDISVKLTVTPTITPDNYIEMKLTPEISDLATSSSGSQYPETITRKADTKLRCKNGDTIILAGLLRRDENTDRMKIPLLGDIPFIGEFFKYTNTTKTNDELVIMITPRIIQNDDVNTER